MSNDHEKQAMAIYDIAHAIAEKAHAGQYRRLPDGRPYIEHCKDVAALMPTWDLKTVAILHDTIEDSDGKVTRELLLAKGIPERIVNAVVAMTKPAEKVPEGQELVAYADYIRTQVKGNDLARKVKLADNYVNLKDRIAGVIAGGTDADEHRKAIAKYAAGMGILME